MTLLLSHEDLAQVLHVTAVIDTVGQAFRAYSAGRTRTPLRLGVEPPGARGVLLVMPCAVEEPRALGTKIVTVFPGNRGRGVPTLSSVYVLSDYETGQALAVMDGGYLTGLRTAAGSAVATSVLAQPRASTLGVFGTGVQAWFHVQTIREVRPLRTVLVAGTSLGSEEEFCARVREQIGLAARPATPEEVSAAEVVATCTTSPTPVVLDEAVVDGAHVNAVGAFTPTTRELPGNLIRRARVIADTRTGVLAEAGDVLIALQEGSVPHEGMAVAAELGEVLLERLPGRTRSDEVTVYKSVGAAFLDATVAALAYREARERGLGTEFAF